MFNKYQKISSSDLKQVKGGSWWKFIPDIPAIWDAAHDFIGGCKEAIRKWHP